MYALVVKHGIHHDDVVRLNRITGVPVVKHGIHHDDVVYPLHQIFHVPVVEYDKGIPAYVLMVMYSSMAHVVFLGLLHVKAVEVEDLMGNAHVPAVKYGMVERVNLDKHVPVVKFGLHPVALVSVLAI